MGRNAPHGEPRRMHGQDAAGPFILRGLRYAPAPQDDGDSLARSASTSSLRAQRSNPESLHGNGLDCFAALALTEQGASASIANSHFNRRHTFASSRRNSPELCSLLRTLLRKRAQGRPGAGLAPTVRCAQIAQKDGTAAYRCGRTPGLPCAMVGRLMPCSPGSRTFLLASLTPRIDDAVDPVGLVHISAKA
jgi:hypothetical protein